MSDEASFLQQIQENWQSIMTGVGASIATMMAMIKSHSRRIDRVEAKADALEEAKATRDELNRSVASLRAEINIRTSELKTEFQSSKNEIRTDLKQMSDNLDQQLTRAIEVAKLFRKDAD